MIENEQDLQRLIEIRVRRVNALAFGIGVGLVIGLGLFVATNWLVLKGGPVVGPHLGLLNQYLPGYQVSFVGSLIGFAYCFILGLCVTYFGATVYNRVADYREGRRQRL